MGAQGNFRLLLGNLQTIYFDDVAVPIHRLLTCHFQFLEEYQRTFIVTCEDRYKKIKCVISNTVQYYQNIYMKNNINTCTVFHFRKLFNHPKGMWHIVAL